MKFHNLAATLLLTAFASGLTAQNSAQAQYQHASNRYQVRQAIPVAGLQGRVAQVNCCSAAPNCGCDMSPGCGVDGPACGMEVAPEPSCGVVGGGILGGGFPSCGNAQCNDPGCAAAPSCEMGPSCGAQPSCGVPSCGCELGVGCGSAFGGGCGGGCPLSCGSCNLGDPLSLFGETCGLSAGGWVSIGYHSKNLPLFNSHADRVNVHQAWLYAEKEADGSNGLGLGGRIDYVYGVDAQDTQSFGIANNHWDNDWDHGIYGSALPQLYMEAAYGNLSVKAGHFFTIIGWEVVTAPDNFFYSHAYTMYNSEPFTHTGVLATLTASEDLTFYGGYTLGWDSGFEDNGDSFLGGVSVSLTDKLSLTYASTGGRFADSPNGTLEKGYMHSLVADLAVTDSLQYIMQSDLLDTENNAGETVRDTIGLNNYLIYSVNDCLSLGARYEWWNVSADSQGFYGDAAPAGLANVATGDFDVTALTLGLNYKPHANVIVRPEIRWDWIDGDMNALALADNTILEDADDSQTTFGIDTIFTF
ncbi:hypothetical protein K239x_10360 [Planctomycetes bacterium K23_9]|uniref:Porin n=2 Tax=Stieleria marina TaxID=1930275 RepID=A0A517NPN9_9BACT|nr:hypothetical protein K239x_10360 [Planctomycetes bacterium K23_9]